jgi:hypothetical protein
MPYVIKVPKEDWAIQLWNPIEDLINKFGYNETIAGRDLVDRNISRQLPIHAELHPGSEGKDLALGAAGSVNPALKIPAEEALNYESDNGGRPIVSPRQQGIESGYQTNSNTSPVAATIGRGGPRGIVAGAVTGGIEGALFDGGVGAAVGAVAGVAAGAKHLSPERIEHIQRGIAGGVGQTVTDAMNPLFANGVSGPPMSKGPHDITSMPIVGTFARPFLGSEYDQSMGNLEKKFYDQAGPLTEKYRTYDYLRKQKPDEAGAYLLANRSEIQKGQIMVGLQKKLADLNGYIAGIQTRPIDPATKTETLRNLNDVKKRLLESYNNLINPTSDRPTGFGKYDGTAK